MGLFIFGLGGVHISLAAGPEVILSWKAKESFVPQGYLGKALPSPLSMVEVKAIAIEGGRLVDLSDYQIRWFLKNYRVAQGQGLTTFTVPAPLKNTDESHDLRVEIVDYPGGAVTKSVSIPIVLPRVVLSGGSLDGSLSYGSYTVLARPYFFMAQALSDLDYQWTVDGVYRGQDSGGVLKLNVTGDKSRGGMVEVQVGVRSPNNPFDQAATRRTFVVR
ncbi:MAG: hypothetical protein KGZ30_04140 [Anaplasmataceae bacterium]|nr:hypothetical protein [Anaplasmataceae bacterium]